MTKKQFCCTTVLTLLISMTACGKTPALSGQETAEAPDFTTPAPQTVIVPTEQETATSTTIVTTAAVAASAVSGSTEQPITGELPEDTQTAASDISALIGKWTFALEEQSGYYYYFGTDGTLQICSEVTDLLGITKDSLTIEENSYAGTYPWTFNGSTVTASDEEGTVILSLTAPDGQAADTLQGDYQINRCALYPDAENRTLFLRMDGRTRWLVANGRYSIIGDSLTMETGSSMFSQTFRFEGEKLIFTEPDGTETVLIRMAASI